jgi:hypothetical protein
MTKHEIVAEQNRLQAIFDAARGAGDRDAAVAASRELSAFITQYNPPKRGGWASRAGRRQYNERMARYRR